MTLTKTKLKVLSTLMKIYLYHNLCIKESQDSILSKKSCLVEPNKI